MHAKIEIINPSKSEYLFKQIKNVVAIISDERLSIPIPQFKKNEIDLIVEFILKIPNE